MPGQPFNPNAVLQSKYDALVQQLDRLNTFLETQSQRQTKMAKEPTPTLRQQQDQLSIFDERASLSRSQSQRQRRGQETLFGGDVGTGSTEIGSPVGDAGDDRLPPDTDARPPKQRANKAALTEEYSKRVGTGGSKIKRALGAISSFAPEPPQPNENASMPPTGGQSLGGLFSNPTGDKQGSMLTWALLGEHGGPAAIRNMALEQYGLQRSVDWAQNAAGLVSKKYDSSKLLQAIPGVNPQTMDALGGALQFATDNPLATYAGYKGIQTIGSAVNQAGANLAGYQAAGQQFGYGPSAAFGQAVFGHQNPLGNFSTAARVGGAFNLENQALQGRMPFNGFGSGLTSAQATSATSTLAGQGFAMQPDSSVGGGLLNAISSLPVIGGPLSGLIAGLTGGGPQGDAANISQNFMRPLMERNPALKGEDLGQFTGSLRYSGTSIQQLADQLNSMGVEARAAKETVGQFASSVASTAKSFEQLGSSPQGGYAIGTGFTNVTGKDAQFAGTLGQSPLVQGLAMSRYGILPSALGDMNSGAFANTSMAALQMLQRATAGLATNKYKMVNGHRVLLESGTQAQYDQIAQMTGLPSNVVKSMLQDQKGVAARANAQTMLGDPTTGTGFYQYLDQHKGKLTDKQYKIASKAWDDTVANTGKGTGISPQEMTRLSHIKGLRDRAKAYSGDLANAAKDDKANQIQGTPNAQTVQVQFTGAAAKFFQQVATGPSAAKQQSNAGVASYNAIVNSQTGDLTGNSAARMGRLL